MRRSDYELPVVLVCMACVIMAWRFWSLLGLFIGWGWPWKWPLACHDLYERAVVGFTM